MKSLNNDRNLHCSFRRSGICLECRWYESFIIQCILYFHVFILLLLVDWLKLRQNYRIVGNLIGSLPKYPRQNLFNGLPLCLQPEEVSLLKENGFAKLVGCSSLSVQPSDSLLNAFEKEENVFNEAQVLYFWYTLTYLLPYLQFIQFCRENNIFWKRKRMWKEATISF